MRDNLPHIMTADGRRRFACSPVAILVFVVNEREKVRLLSHPERQGGWQVVNGALEAGEAQLAGALRKTREVAGAGVRYRRAKQVMILQDGKPVRYPYAEVDHCCQDFALVDRWLDSGPLQRRGSVGHGEAGTVARHCPSERPPMPERDRVPAPHGC